MKNRFCMKRLFFVLLLGLSICCALSGCHGPQYTEEEKEELEKRGEALMRAWLDEHVEDVGALTAEADVYRYPSGPHLLTDFVAGSFAEGGKVRDYLVNTKTSAVYLIHDGTLLSGVCLDYAFEKLGLESLRGDCRVIDHAAVLWLPDRGNSYMGVENVENGVWMPGELVLSLEKAEEGAGGEDGNEEELELLEAFVRSPDKREAIEYGGTILVPEEVNLEKFGMAYWLKQKEENGIVFENFYLSDAFENISTYRRRASYERYCFREIEDPDIRIFMRDIYWVEKNGKNGIEVVEGKESDLSDLKFKKTESGYLVTFTDYDHIFDFSIYADEGSDFLKHEYHSHEDREAYLSPGSTIGGDKYFEKDLYWKKAKEGGYVLANEDGTRKLFFGGEELIPRDERQQEAS